MPQTPNKGNCYLCGQLISKSGFKSHLFHTHPYDGKQACVVLKVESAGSKRYGLYLDIPATATLETLNAFLRRIWLDCCGHMSAFFVPNEGEIEMSRKLSSFPVGFSLLYAYDFGDTTQLEITFVDCAKRPRQVAAVRLLGRNEAPKFYCRHCGKPADYICTECAWERDDPFVCEQCLPEHEHGEEMMLPVVNSPRMGVCAYDGDWDTYTFDPTKYEE